jgi:hypothetical protein
MSNGGLLFNVALTQAVANALWKGAGVAAFASLFATTFGQFASDAFLLGASYVLVLPLLTLGLALTILFADRRALSWGPSLRALGATIVAASLSFAGYLAFYSLFSEVYGQLGAADTSNLVAAIDWYRRAIAPLTQMVSAYVDDVIVGLITTGLSALIIFTFSRRKAASL